MKRRVNVLGTEYTVDTHRLADDPYLKGLGGYCDDANKEIVLADLSDKAVYDYDDKAQKVEHCRILRHELLHAFLNESGLRESSSWAKDECCVDWFAAQFPKLLKAYMEFGIESDD